MREIGRREFTAGALAGLGILLPRPAAPYVITRSRQLPAYRYRKNVYCLTAYSPEIRAYKKAIEVMRARPATDGTSWQAQANIHGAFRPNPPAGIVNACPPATSADMVAPPGMIADVCRHDGFFLAWHRMYLHYFERIVRAASGDPTFALPYWGYSPGGQRDLPAVFRSPASTANALWTDQRVAGINAGSNLNASAVDASGAMGNIVYSAFQSSLSGTPHGVVHVSVGGGCGWMSYFETAGMDPIFWLHHCNIDRLWEDWLASGGGRVNPTGDPTWMNQSFSFYDETGATVSLTVSQILETATQLGYRYAAPTVCRPRYCYCLPWRPWLLDVRVMARLDTIVARRALPRPVPAIQRQQPDTLAAAARDIRLPIDAQARGRLDALLRDPQGGRGVKLVMDDIRMVAQPAVYYEIYVNLPAGGDTVYTSPHYVGSLDFFGSAKAPQHPREFDLLGAYVRLQGMGRWPRETLRVTLVPRAPVEGRATPAQLLRNRPQATVGRMAIVIE